MSEPEQLDRDTGSRDEDNRYELLDAAGGTIEQLSGGDELEIPVPGA